MPSPFSYKNDSDEDQRASPEERAKQLHKQEQQTGFDKDFNELTSPEHLAKDGKEGDLGKDVRDAEDRGGNWKNNTTSNYGGKKSQAGKKVTPMNVRAILKKRGPLGLIALLGLGGGILGTALFSPGLLLVQMKESLVDRFDTQLASMDARSTKILNQKISGTTTGVCGAKITIKCKYSTISEKQAARLKAQGIDVEGDSTKIGSRIKPNTYTFNGGDPMDSKTFAAKIKTDPALSSAMRKAYNPKYAGFADKIWNKVAGKLGVTKQRALVDGDDDAKTKALDDDVKNGKKIDISNDGVTCNSDGSKCTRKGPNGENIDLTEEERAARKSAIAAAGDVADDAAKDASKAALAGIDDGVKSGMTAVGSFIKVTSVADTACQAYSSVRALGYAAKTIRAVQLARYAMAFVNTADQIKAGTAKPEDVAYLGGILTNIAYDAKSSVKRKAAMDSAGMKYTLYGDSSGFRGKGSSYVSQFMAGGGLTGDLIAVTDYINASLNPLGGARSTCATLSNGWVQAGSIIAGIGLMLIPGVDVAVSVGDVAKVALNVAAGIGMAILPDLLKTIVAGNVTQGLIGEDAGNAITSGFGVMTSDTAQAGGNATMSVDQAVAYTTLNNEVADNYSKDEAKTLSPFDSSNKNTFVGSIVSRLLPFVSTTGSIGNPFTAFSSLTSSSLASILPTASALSTEETRTAYSSCTDPDYTDPSVAIATDPFCNPIFGIPQQYLSRDPMEVADALTGQYDEVTGKPIEGSEYAKYVDNCINREDPIGSNGADGSNPSDGSECKISNENANYYLFYIDQRVDDDMDGYADTGASDTTADSTIDQEHVYDDSTSVACATGTDDAGTAQGYHNGTEIDIRLCSIPNTTDETHGNGPMKVNSRISGATLAITQALAASSANGGNPTLRVADSFRSMEEQEEAVAEYGYPRAARPGFSNHQMGLAIDFQLGSNNGATRPGDPVYDWLVANAKNYGFGKISSEAWHWQALGADDSVAM